MRGWLIYDSEGAARNQAFIDFWFQAANAKGIELELVMAESPMPEPLPDFAVVRTMNPELSMALEAKGVCVFNSAYVSEVCNDKWKTYCLAEKLGIPYPSAEFIPDPAKMDKRPYPFVIKACSGHGGTQVYMVSDDQSFRQAVQALCGVPCVAQEVVSDLGKDLRIYVLGNRVIAAMMRTSDKDFRSNFCLGGNASAYRLECEELAIVESFCKALDFGLIGIDLMYHKGQPVFNEIEDVVGCRMLYGNTDLDPVSMYLDHILQNLSKTKQESSKKL